MPTATATEVVIEGKQIKLTNLTKLMWPEGLTKAHLVKYYTDIAPYLLPHLRGRPLVMKRYPDGIAGKHFYQKECPEYAPEWIQTVSIVHSGKMVNYIVCEDRATLAWLANQGCIEMHAWLSQKNKIENPDLAIIDLDPGEAANFDDVMEVALVVKKVLDQLQIKGYPKTSGASGIHIFIPVEPCYTFQEVTKAMGVIAQLVTGTLPKKATIERSLDKRGAEKIYVDYLQNTRGKSMAWTYSVRPLPGATVSTPILWEEIEQRSILPQHFTMETIFQRLAALGDLHQNMLEDYQSLSSILRHA
ncbi:non-homologous end-joining DNA ligase [Desulforamulus aeronauticus]|uniref:Bifunctional non-homologous end joining protein LigD n=1 Tax=Desulforamulus aeronauticus DSM 10349 TaxID=1121421 RepID=A0A1M6U8Y3_9FIRM|nr:non-homologous end-joining DNA ligase [Desulforamulus aeronauticus]SHK65629.1 bifunctional non-homologous end joining protein LigD [Desulforamulus aeronauticus DSM 10349]